GGTYRVNRRLTYTVGDGRVEFTSEGASVRVIPTELKELAQLRGFDEDEALEAIAARFEQREVQPGEHIARDGEPVDGVHLIAHGRVEERASGPYGDEAALDVLTGGDHLGEQAFVETDGIW